MINDHSFGGKHLPRKILTRVGDAGRGQEMHRVFFGALLAAAVLSTAGCGGAPELPPAPPASSLPSAEYRIGPGDSLNIFVWRNPELTVTVPVRPDGRVSIPLVEDVVAIGKTPTASPANTSSGSANTSGSRSSRSSYQALWVPSLIRCGSSAKRRSHAPFPIAP